MNIALATYDHLPDWQNDETPLHAALESLGHDVRAPSWTDPSVDWSGFDACVLRTTWDYMERHDEFAAWTERVSAETRLFNPLPVVRWNSHKSYLRDLAGRGVRTVPTVWLETGATVDLCATLAERGWSRAFLKPAIGATARETLRFTDRAADLAAAQAHVDRLLAVEDMLLQPYLAKVETEGEVSAIFIDRAFSHAVRKRPVPGDYRVQDDFGAHDEPTTLTAGDIADARRALDATGFDDLLYARADFLRDDDGALCLTELELIEPLLFFRHDTGAARRLAEALHARLS